VFVKKTGDDATVKIASNHVVEQLFQQTGRYRVEIERNDTHKLRRVWYTLRISSMSVSMGKKREELKCVKRKNVKSKIALL